MRGRAGLDLHQRRRGLLRRAAWAPGAPAAGFTRFCPERCNLIPEPPSNRENCRRDNYQRGDLLPINMHKRSPLLVILVVVFR